MNYCIVFKKFFEGVSSIWRIFSKGSEILKRLIALQAIGCLLFAGIITALWYIGVFSPLSVIIAYLFLGLCNILNAKTMLMNPIEALSRYDKLTGCFNRTTLDSKINEYEKFSDYAIIFFDVNNLKKMNDIHGHSDGDKILIKASNQLRFWHKYGDLYRLGGDEFIVVVTNMTRDKLESIVDEWHSCLPALNEDYEDDFVCNFSYGICYKTSSDSKTFHDVMESADEKMY